MAWPQSAYPHVIDVEAGSEEGQGKRERPRTKGNSFQWGDDLEGLRKRIGGIQEGGIPAIQLGPIP